MTDQPSRHGRRRPRMPRQRDRVLELVREYQSPVDAVELASRLGLHVTTVRFHLDALCKEGIVTRTRITRAGVGRPRTGYAAVRGRLDYQSFAEILALGLGSNVETRRRRAERAGRRLADQIVANPPWEDPATPRISDSGSAIVDRQAAMTVEIFERMGFCPELVQAAKPSGGKGQRVIRLHACPVREVARTHPEVGCALHLGLLQGLLANSTVAEGKLKTTPTPALKAELEPFVEPELCVARVIADD